MHFVICFNLIPTREYSDNTEVLPTPPYVGLNLSLPGVIQLPLLVTSSTVVAGRYFHLQSLSSLYVGLYDPV